MVTGHPTHAARPIGCRAPVEQALAIEQTSGRQGLNVHGALDLETGKTAMIDVETIDAASTIRLLEAVEAMYPLLATIHVFLDNARYRHAKLVQEWLAQPARRIELRFIPACCPHLTPNERLWGVMHKHPTHNKFIPPIGNSRRLCWIFCLNTPQGAGRNFARRSPTTSPSSIRRIFGFWRERGICYKLIVSLKLRLTPCLTL
jgi:transposase